MATDYISRAAVLGLKQTPGAYGKDIDSREVCKLLAADVRENVTGTWTRHDTYISRDYLCSNCKKLNDRPSKFCPDCGAEMRMAKLKTGDKYVLEKNIGDLEAGETVVVERVNEHQGDEITYCVKISSDSRPGYWVFDYIQPGEEPEVVGNRERAVL